MENGQTLLFILGVLVSISSIGGFVATLVFNSRRRPPLPEEVAKTYVRKDEFKSEISRIEKRIDDNILDFKRSLKGLEDKVDSLERTFSRQSREWERALGRIEGSLKTKKGIQ